MRATVRGTIGIAIGGAAAGSILMPLNAKVAIGSTVVRMLGAR